ncbi:MAG: hypothetical protein JWM58_2719 [Rhizobium sp.]|nr:hypothetical protein [Rhizobium sp.]
MPERTDPINLQDFLNARLEALVADANAAGWGTEDVLAGLTKVMQNQWRAYDHDPDPADDADLEATRAARIDVPAKILEDLDTEEGVSRGG